VGVIGRTRRPPVTRHQGPIAEKIGEVAVPPADHRHIRLPGNESTFTGFDRNPCLADFHAKGWKRMSFSSTPEGLSVGSAGLRSETNQVLAGTCDHHGVCVAPLAVDLPLDLIVDVARSWCVEVERVIPDLRVGGPVIEDVGV